MPIIVKRHGHLEDFDERKVYGSVYAACSSAHYPDYDCEKIADKVTKSIKKFIKGKRKIESKKYQIKLNLYLRK